MNGEFKNGLSKAGLSQVETMRAWHQVATLPNWHKSPVLLYRTSHETKSTLEGKTKGPKRPLGITNADN